LPSAKAVGHGLHGFTRIVLPSAKDQPANVADYADEEIPFLRHLRNLRTNFI